MGYIRGFAHGAVIGTIAGLCVAPQTGKRTREQLSAFGSAAKEGYGLAERTFRRVSPMVTPFVAKMRHAEAEVEFDDDGIDVESTVRIHDHTNGNGHGSRR